MSEIDHLYWEDEVARETPEELIFGVSQPFHHPNRKEPAPFSYRRCLHWRQRFDLNGGLHVFASAWLDEPKFSSDKEGFAGDPDIGFYLDGCWGKGKVLTTPGLGLPILGKSKAASQTLIFPCEDYGAPEDRKMFLKCLKWILKQAQKGMIIDVGCMGGHGRTGTTLASLLVVQGMRPHNAIKRVRTRYCKEAIESQRQERFIRSLPR